MSAISLIHQIESMGLTMFRRGNKLRIEGEVEQLSEALKDELRKRKQEILQKLEQADRALSSRAYHVVLEDGHKMTVLPVTGEEEVKRLCKEKGWQLSHCYPVGALH